MLPLYRGAQVVRYHHQIWTSMTAVVVDLRSSGQILSELGTRFTRICISLEEVGGTFKISGERRLPPPTRMARGAISIISPGSKAHGTGDGLTFLRQLLLQVDQSYLMKQPDPIPSIQAALAPRSMFCDFRVLGLARLIADECHTGKTANPFYSDAITRAFLTALTEAAKTNGERIEAGGGLAPWRLARVTQYVLENISDPPQLENQAAISGLSKSHYCRAFKASMGISPHQWLLKARIEQAKQYLLAGGMPLAQVALASGFTDQAHFAHTFSKLEGVSPRAWQRTRATSPDWMKATVPPFTPASN